MPQHSDYWILAKIARLALQHVPSVRQISQTENKVEGDPQFTNWLRFGSHGVISHHAPEEHEQRIQYNDLVASALILQNVVDRTVLLRQLAAEGDLVNAQSVATLSPFLNRHDKRFGES